MNLTNPRTRRSALAFTVTAAVAVGGVSVGASSASAATLTLSPSTSNVTIVNTDPALNNASAALTYQFRTTDATTPARIQLVSGPTGGTLKYAAHATLANVSLAATYTGSLASPTNSTQVSASLSAANLYVGVGATVPGQYVVRLYSDVIADGEYDPTQDNATGTLTVNVKDATGATATAADDVSLPMTTTSSLVKGGVLTTTVSLASLTTSDVRGTSSGIGVLGSAVAGALEVSLFNPTPARITANETETYSGTTLTSTYTTLVGSPTGTWTSYLVFDDDVDTDFGTYSGGTDNASGFTLLNSNTTTVSDNGVTGVTGLSVTDVQGTVKQVNATTVAVKNGTRSVDWVATVTDADTDKSGNVVYFTIGGTDAADVTTNKTTFDAAARIFSSTTDADGKARITITDNAATPAGYTVTAASNGYTIAARTATYAAAAATSVEITNSGSSLYPTVGQSVTLTGRVLDQFGAVYQPTNAQPQQVEVQIPTGNPVGFATVTNGTFSFVYTPASTPTAGTSTTFTFDYQGATDAGVIRWATTAAAASITVSTPTDGATPTLADFNTLPSTTVSGTVKDNANAGLAYKTVTLTGGNGVYFSETSNGADLTTSLPVTTDGSGNFTAYAFFTRAGSNTVTVTAGTASKQVSVHVADASGNDAPYRVTVDDTEGTSGDTLVVTGKVTDIFGNPVTGAQVNLSTGTSVIGALTSTTPVTNSAGIWSTTFITGSNQQGDVTLTATLHGQTQNRTADDAVYGDTGLDLNSGDYQSTGTIKVKSEEVEAPTTVTLTGPSSRVGRGTVTLSGTTKAGSVVDIYLKPTEGALGLVDTVTADSEGAFTANVTISRTTTFVAKVGAVTSSAKTVTVVSTVRFASFKVLGNGRVRLTADGGPNGGGTIIFYRKISATQIAQLGRVTANSSGDGSLTVRVGAGAKTFRVTYTSPGARVSAQSSLSLRIR